MSENNDPKTQNSILIIEDNPDMRTYIREIVERDFQILEAANGEEGIKMAIQHIPDIIISDLMMPKKNGYEVCRAIKQDEKTGHIPIILLTAKAALENKIEGLQTGADDYLVKPFDTKELHVRIDNLIEIRRSLQRRYRHLSLLPVDTIPTTSPDEAFLRKVTETVHKYLETGNFNLDVLFEATHTSRQQFYRKFKALTGETPASFIKMLRMKHAEELLKTTDLTISEIAFKCGYDYPDNFSRAFTSYKGSSPKSIRDSKSTSKSASQQ